MFDVKIGARSSDEAKLLANIIEIITSKKEEPKKEEPKKEEPKKEEPKGYYCKVCKVEHATAGERIKCGMKNKKG